MRKMEDSSKPDIGEMPSNAAQYIRVFADELAQLARRHGLNSLGFILDMARLEAEENAKD